MSHKRNFRSNKIHAFHSKSLNHDHGALCGLSAANVLSLCHNRIIFHCSAAPLDLNRIAELESKYDINGELGPQQIHIAYGDTPQQMTVMWSTPSSNDFESSIVHYGMAPNKYDLSACGKTVNFTLGNPSGLQFIHRVQLKNLKPGQKYSYRVQSGDAVSNGYEFTTMRDDLDWAPQFLVYGDMGRHGGAPTLSRLIDETKSGENTAVLHVGDFAYDFNSEGGMNGDQFMNRIQDIAAYLPYMTCVGNHEIPFNFSHYRYRFSMPQLPWPTTVERMWHSWNIARVHFISYSTEVYYTKGAVEEQLKWLAMDLAEANKPENRTKRPWIIAFGHRPMYCSNIDQDLCKNPATYFMRKSLEPVFFKYGVDLIIEAHEHSYERLWPVYNLTVTAHDYDNPRAPVHLISGAAGCNEFYGICVNPMLGPRGAWSAFREWFPGTYGYGRLKVVNTTHLYWEQRHAWDGDVIDSIWIKQEKHGPFKPLNETFDNPSYS